MHQRIYKRYREKIKDFLTTNEDKKDKRNCLVALRQAMSYCNLYYFNSFKVNEFIKVAIYKKARCLKQQASTF